MINILCLSEVADCDRKELSEIARDCSITYSNNDAVTKEELAAADILYGMPTQEHLRQAKNLKWLQATNAGIEKYLPYDVTRKEAVISNASGFFTEALCESAIAMLLALTKKIPQYYANQKQHLWKDECASTEIAGANALIVGFGAAGMSIGRVLHAFGAKITGVRKQNLDVPAFAQAVVTPDALPELLPTADILIFALPYTRETDGLFGKALFSHVKRGAILINIGRGKTIDQSALTEALQNGTLGGAGLDVFAIEPLPEDDPLWEMENVIVMPHVAGREYMPLAMERNITLFKENLKRYLKNDPLLQVVDRAVGYNPYYKAGGCL